MRKTKLISQAVIGTMLSFALATLSGQVVQADDSIALMRAPCATTGPGRWRSDKSNVAVGRAVYKSRWHLGPGNRFVSITCRIVPEGFERYFQTLQLEFGMQDDDRNSPANTVNVYLDGQQKLSRTLTAGQRESVSLDVTNVANVAIETVCSSQSQYCGRVYFFKAELESPPPPPKSK